MIVAAFFAGYALTFVGVAGLEGTPEGVTITGEEGGEDPAAFVAVAVMV